MQLILKIEKPILSFPVLETNLLDLLRKDRNGEVGLVKGIKLVIEETLGGNKLVNVKVRVDNTDYCNMIDNRGKQVDINAQVGIMS